MLLGVISMFCFGILRIFGGNRKNEENWEIWSKIGLLRRNVGNPRRGVGNPLHGVDLRQGVGHPCHNKAEVPKWQPSGMPRCSYYSQREKFWVLFRKSSFCTLKV